MQRDSNSSRSLKWYRRNTPQYCTDYVSSLCLSYGIKNFSFKERLGQKALFIDADGITFIFTIDPSTTRLQSYVRKYSSKMGYEDIPKLYFENDSCWIHAIQWYAKQKPPTH